MTRYDPFAYGEVHLDPKRQKHHVYVSCFTDLSLELVLKDEL